MGTLFERALDVDQRAQLGAHYTSEDDIKTLVEPVLMAPLRREWAELQGWLLTPDWAGAGESKTKAAAARCDALAAPRSLCSIRGGARAIFSTSRCSSCWGWKRT